MIIIIIVITSIIIIIRIKNQIGHLDLYSSPYLSYIRYNSRGVELYLLIAKFGVLSNSDIYFWSFELFDSRMSVMKIE
jgi:hypothetical protein